MCVCGKHISYKKYSVLLLKCRYYVSILNACSHYSAFLFCPRDAYTKTADSTFYVVLTINMHIKILAMWMFLVINIRSTLVCKYTAVGVFVLPLNSYLIFIY